MNPRIGIVLNSFSGGGAERSALITAGAWPDPKAAILVACIAEGPYSSAVPESLKTAELCTWPKLANLRRFSLSLNEVAETHRIGVWIANGYGLTHMVLLSRLFRPKPDTRIVVVERAHLSRALAHRFTNPLARWAVLRLTRWLYRRADAIVGVSDGVSRDLERTLGLPTGSVITIHNPVDTEHIAQAIEGPIPDELERAFGALRAPVVITTGRLVEQKAHRDLLAAFAGLPQDRRGSLVILGEGPLRQALERQADRLGIRDRVWMPGFVDNPWWFIARSDVFALSSHWEGHPRAILEALACNTPIVSTDCPSGPREILADAPGAQLTPVGDTHALTRSIIRLLSDRVAVDVDLTRYRPANVARRYAAIAARVGEDAHLLGYRPPA